MTDEAQEVVVEERENGPLVLKNLDKYTDTDGSELEAKPVMALCRCGQSGNKPFCDGSHKEAGFSSAPGDVSAKDKIYSYEGKDVTIHYNKVLCSHAAECGKIHKAVFDPSKKPWVQPDNGPLELSMEVVAACPSGALSYSKNGGDPEQITDDNVSMKIERNGPYHMRNVSISDVKWAKTATDKKFVLCRCGLSSNKPFCDGTHLDERWRDDA